MEVQYNISLCPSVPKLDHYHQYIPQLKGTFYILDIHHIDTNVHLNMLLSWLLFSLVIECGNTKGNTKTRGGTFLRISGTVIQQMCNFGFGYLRNEQIPKMPWKKNEIVDLNFEVSCLRRYESLYDI